jgi:hypothetical protein
MITEVAKEVNIKLFKFLFSFKKVKWFLRWKPLMLWKRNRKKSRIKEEKSFNLKIIQVLMITIRDIYDYNLNYNKFEY